MMGTLKISCSLQLRELHVGEFAETGLPFLLKELTKTEKKGEQFKGDIISVGPFYVQLGHNKASILNSGKRKIFGPVTLKTN